MEHTKTYRNPETGEEWRTTANPGGPNGIWAIWKKKPDLDWEVVNRTNRLDIANDVIREKCGGASAVEIHH